MRTSAATSSETTYSLWNSSRNQDTKYQRSQITATVWIATRIVRTDFPAREKRGLFQSTGKASGPKTRKRSAKTFQRLAPMAVMGAVRGVSGTGSAATGAVSG